jgi:hypothetical protein
MRAIQRSFETLRKQWVAFVVMNLVYFGLVVGGMVYAAFNRPMQVELANTIGNELVALEDFVDARTGGWLSAQVEARNPVFVLAAALAILAVNALLGSLAEITLPSLIVPFSGLLVGVFRAMAWGVLFSPEGISGGGVALLGAAATLLLLLLEGEGYVLAMLAAYLQGMAFLFPQRVGVPTRRQGFVAGLRMTARLYLLVVLVLGAAAAYEAVLAILVLPGVR